METKEQSKIQKLMKSKPAKAGVSVALVGTLALAGIGAYFTGTDTVENKLIGVTCNTGRSAHRLARPPLYDERKAST